MTGPSQALSPNSRGGSSGPLYDLRLNPPYLVDYTSILSGKRVAATKRRVRFRFGFSNREALAAGATGIDCRGCEHDVTLVWSHTSGKRLIVADGKEVHFSVGKPTQGKFQFTWSMAGGHTLKLIGHAAPPLKQAPPGWKQFDLQLDGMSVFDMPKIFELGVKAGRGAGRDRDSRAVVARRSSPRAERGGGGGQQRPYSNYAMPREEEMAWARNVERYEERRNMDRLSYPPGANAPPGVEAPPPDSPPRSPPQRRSFAEPPPPAQHQQQQRSPSFAQPPSSVTVPAAATAAAAGPADLVSDAVPGASDDLLAASNATYENQVVRDEFAPQPVAPPPPPTYQDVAGAIMGSYAPAPAAQQPPPASPPQQQQQLPALPPGTNYEQPPAQTPVQRPPAPAPAQAPAALPPAQLTYEQQPQPQQQQYYQQPPQPTYEQPPAPTYEQQPPAQTYEQQQQAYYQQQAPAPVQTQAYSPQQQQQYYQQPAVVTPAAGGAPAYQGAEENYQPTDLGAAQVSPNGVEAIDNIPFNLDENQGGGNKDVDDVARAMKNLVNLEDISAAPEESLENMREALRTNPFAEKNVPQSKKDKLNRAQAPRSTPKPPAGQGWALAGKSLAEVQAITREHKPSQPSQEVMKPNAFDPSAGGHGMMVVYGQPGQGPPALQQVAQGFGVGATLQNGGYAVRTQ